MAGAIQQEVLFKTSPKRIYEALLDSRQFTEFSGAPAEISRESGGAFSCFGGVITGRNIELRQQGSETHLTMDHVGFPQEMRAHLNGEAANGGWHRQYWEPLKKYFS